MITEADKSQDLQSRLAHWSPRRADASVRAQRWEKANVPVQRHQTGGILSYLGEVQPFSWLDKAHPQEGEQFALLGLPICVNLIHKHPLRHTQNHV